MDQFFPGTRNSNVKPTLYNGQTSFETYKLQFEAVGEKARLWCSLNVNQCLICFTCCLLRTRKISISYLRRWNCILKNNTCSSCFARNWGLSSKQKVCETLQDPKADAIKKIQEELQSKIREHICVKSERSSVQAEVNNSDALSRGPCGESNTTSVWNRARARSI